MSNWQVAVNTAGVAATMMVLAGRRTTSRRDRARELRRTAFGHLHAH